MTVWSEENFLERLMPRSQQQGRTLGESCPDSESLCAFAENRAGGVVRDAIAAHLAECSECADLHHRLLEFAEPAITLDAVEWQGAEKRLDNWMAAFLPIHGKSAHSERELSRLGQKQWNWFSPWKVQWALSAVAVVALLAAITVLVKLGIIAHQAVQTVAVTHPIMPAPTQIAPPITPREEQAANPAPVEKPAQSGSSASKIATKPEPPRQHVISPSDETPPSELADAAGADMPVSTQPQNSAPSAPIQASPRTNVGGTAGSFSGLGISGPLRTGAQTRPAGMVANHAPAPAPTAAPKAYVDLPNSFRLEAGTRVWIRLDSLARQPDGSLRFQGTLFEPISQAGGVSLDKGTEVDGLEIDSNGRTSLVVTAFVVQGVQYTLRGSADGTTARAGSASAVPFDNQQVMETFIEATSVYEKAAGQR